MSLRSVYQRDRDRIVHSIPFRRLEYKTQVFVNFEGDHFRTRLTHSLEVAQIARAMARALGVNEDLAEAIALAHDLGHSAFGHAGEAALDEALADFGGFDHNLQTFRIVTRLERRYAGFDGLNLTFETLEGLVKHHGPVEGEVPAAVAEHPLAARMDLRLQPPLEAQLAAIADDVAYTNHDLDDGLRAGFFALDELAHLPLAGSALAEVDRRYPGLEAPRRVHETIRRLIDGMVRDLIDGARRRLAELQPRSPGRCPGGQGAVVAFSPQVGCWPGRAAGVLARSGLSPLQGQPHDAQGAARGARAGRRSVAGARLPAGRLARPGGPAQHAGHRRHRTGLYRRHDRSLRARRARPPVQA